MPLKLNVSLCSAQITTPRRVSSKAVVAPSERVYVSRGRGQQTLKLDCASGYGVSIRNRTLIHFCASVYNLIIINGTTFIVKKSLTSHLVKSVTHVMICRNAVHCRFRLSEYNYTFDPKKSIHSAAGQQLQYQHSAC